MRRLNQQQSQFLIHSVLARSTPGPTASSSSSTTVQQQQRVCGRRRRLQLQQRQPQPHVSVSTDFTASDAIASGTRAAPPARRGSKLSGDTDLHVASNTAVPWGITNESG